jgi:glycosyltransferase involved in cell wall biosynthesis
MRIAYLVSQYPAASHTFIRREVAGLRARGFEVETFSIRPPTGVSKLADIDRREAETTWYVLPASAARLARSHARALLKRPGSYVSTLRRALGHRVPGVRALLWAAFHFAESIDLAGELERRGVDHLHNHFANSGANVGLLAAHFLRVKWCRTLRGTSEGVYPAGQLLAEKIEAARFVACVTHFGRAQAMRIVDPKHWHKFVIVRAGIERPPLPPRDGPGPEANGSAQRPLVLCVARLSPEKGHAGLLQAFARLVAGGVDARLELLGDGPERRRIEEQIRVLGLGERVVLRGQVSEDQVLEALTRATVLVLASFMEGLPVTLMEALALGVPVVAPCVAGIPELVEHGVSGLTFPPGDWDRLAQVLRDLLADPALQQRLAREGRRRVESEYFVERSLEPLVGAFGLPSVL